SAAGGELSVNQVRVDMVEKREAAIAGLHRVPSQRSSIQQSAVVLETHYEFVIESGMRPNALDLPYRQVGGKGSEGPHPAAYLADFEVVQTAVVPQVNSIFVRSDRDRVLIRMGAALGPWHECPRTSRVAGVVDTDAAKEHLGRIRRRNQQGLVVEFLRKGVGAGARAVNHAA